MKKYLLPGLIVILVACGAYYAGTQRSAQPISKTSISEKQPSLQAGVVQPEVVQLLEEIAEVVRRPNVKVDNILDFLLVKYGPCWGVPEGECRE